MARDQKKPVKKTVKKASAKAAKSDLVEIKKKPLIEGDEEEAPLTKDRPINIGDDFEVPIEGGDDFGGPLESEDEDEDDTLYGASSDDEVGLL